MIVLTLACYEEQQYVETNAQSVWRLSHDLLRMAGTRELLTTKQFPPTTTE